MVIERRTAPAERPPYMRTAQAVSNLLDVHPVLSELHRWGIRVLVTAEPEMILAEAEALGKPNWPTFESRIAADRWWQPEDETHYERIAARLAADLRMKWDRWQSGVG